MDQNKQAKEGLSWGVRGFERDKGVLLNPQGEVQEGIANPSRGNPRLGRQVKRSFFARRVLRGGQKTSEAIMRP